MFSSNDINMSWSSDTFMFTDPSTVENQNSNAEYWTMNYDDLDVRYINSSGYLNYIEYSKSYSIRPVLFLENNLSFTGGNGTAQNPYTLQ